MATNGLDCLCGLMVFLSPFFLAVLINGVREEMKKK